MKRTKSIAALLLICFIIIGCSIPTVAQELSPEPRAQICGSCGRGMVPTGGLIKTHDENTREWNGYCPFGDDWPHWHDQAVARQKWTCPTYGDSHGSYILFYANGLFCGKKNSYYFF